MHRKIIIRISLFLATVGALVLLPISIKQEHRANKVAVRIEASESYAASIGTYAPYPSGTTKILQNGYDPNSPDGGAWVTKLYNTCKTIVNIFLVAVLIVFAFANILNFNIDTYSIKKALPKIIFVAIVANLALPLIALVSAALDSLQSSVHLFSPALFTTPAMSIGFMAGGITIMLFAILSYLLGGPKAFSIILCCTNVFFPLVAVVLIGLILGFRPYIIWLATALSPIAIACSLLPQTETIYKKWLKVIAVWLVTPVAMYAIFHIADLIPSSMTTTKAGWITAIIGVYLPMVLKYALMLLAVRVPFMLDKDVASIVAKVGSYIGKQALAAPAAIGYWNKAAGLENAVAQARSGTGVFTSNKFNPLGLPFVRKGVAVGGDFMRQTGAAVTDLPKFVADKAKNEEEGGFFTNLSKNRAARLVMDRIPSATLWSELPTLMKTEQEVRQKAIRDNTLENTNMKSLIGTSAVLKIQMEQSKGNADDKGFAVLKADIDGDDGIGNVEYGANGEISRARVGKWTKILDESLPSFAPKVVKKILTQQGLETDEFLDVDQVDEKGNVLSYKLKDNDALKVLFAQHAFDYIASTGSKNKNSQFVDGIYDSMLTYGKTTTDLTDLREAVTSLKRKSGQSNPPRTLAGAMQIDPELRRQQIEERRDRQLNRERDERERRNRNQGPADPDDYLGFSGRPSHDPDVEDDTDDALKKQSVELTNPEAIASALASQGGIKADVSDLISASNQNFSSVAKQLQEAGMNENQIASLVAGYRTGSIKQAQDLSQILPQTLASRYAEIHSRVSRSEMQRSLAFQKAMHDPQAQEIRTVMQQLLPRFEALSANNAQPLRQAAITIQMNTTGQSQISPEVLNKMRSIVGDALRINSSTVDARMAQRVVQAFDLLALKQRSGG